VIRATLIVAAEEGSEPIATGTVVEGSTLGGTPFCVGGTILESHASLDPKMKEYLIDRKITCPDGSVRIGFTPEVGAGPDPEGQTPQKGAWTIVSGTGEFEGLSGSGKARPCMARTPVRRFAPRSPEPSRNREHVDGGDSRRTQVPVKEAVAMPQRLGWASVRDVPGEGIYAPAVGLGGVDGNERVLAVAG
jgi:hypothetical protein